jgi:hypothetical protein
LIFIVYTGIFDPQITGLYVTLQIMGLGGLIAAVLARIPLLFLVRKTTGIILIFIVYTGIFDPQITGLYVTLQIMGLGGLIAAVLARIRLLFQIRKTITGTVY